MSTRVSAPGHEHQGLGFAPSYGTTRHRPTRAALFGMHDGCYLRVAYGALQKETVAEGIGRLVCGLKAIINM